MGMCRQHSELNQGATTSKEWGFTLVELMITVAIIGILAAVAIPAYQDYVRRGRVAEAVGALSSMQARMEQYFLDNRTYVGACVAGTLAPRPPDTANFTYQCDPQANAYTVTATGRGGMAGFVYSLTLAGGVVTRTTDGLPDGWSGNGSQCWVSKRDGSC